LHLFALLFAAAAGSGGQTDKNYFAPLAVSTLV
jgi:hypothetical protein